MMRKSIGSLCEILNGFAFKSSEYVQKGTRIIKITNVQKGVVVDDDPKYYPDAAMRSLASYSLRENDLLMSLTGNVGRVGILPKEMLPAALNQRVACLRIRDDNVLLRYLFYCLNSDFFEKAAISSASGIAQKNMSTRWLEQFEIPVPSLSDQRRIVDELDLLSCIIEKKNAQLRTLDELASTIFYEMFGDPVSNEKGWATRKMKDVAPQKVYHGNIPSSDGKYWLLNLDMVESQTGRVIEKVLFTPDEIGNSTTTFNEDNVLYSKLRPYLNKVVVPDEPGYCTSELVPLLPNKGIVNRIFLAYLLRSKFFVEYISARVAGAKMPRVTMSDFREFDIIIPPLKLQESFAERISTLDKQKSIINASLPSSENLLASRMDKYFNE